MSFSNRVNAGLNRTQTNFMVLLVGLIGVCFVVPTQVSAQQSTDDQRSIGDYRRDVKTFMKLSKSDKDPTQRSAIFNLCALHYELVNDSRFRSSSQVQGFRVVVANRLESFAKDETKRLKKQNVVKAKQERKVKRKQSDSSSASIPQELGSEMSVELEEQKQADAVYQSALQSYDSLAQLSGGPANVFNYADGRMGAPWDHGELLVNLIQNTIDPAFWRDNGGNGTIHYYRPSRVLVINGSQRIHELTEDLLWKLRASY